MRSIVPSPVVEKEHLTLVSSLRAQGFAVGKAGERAAPGAMHLVAAGEAMAVPSRTVIVGSAGRTVMPHRDGNPARIAYGHADAAVGNAFARALVGGPELPTAADPETLALFALADRVAQADITVLVNGPTGTGKEVLARTIHLNSPRRDGPFIAINCAALPETMLEAMLFGHQKGAFTGASAAGEGFFRAADGGTILLDEIAEMPLGLQAKLLRVLQEREVVPIGATQPVAVDVRVVACANRDLQAEVAAGRFRADLYYRLSVFPLTTKPLADRPQDIPALAATMILRHAGARPVVPWPSDDAIAALLAHDWPGNVRELENVIQRAMLFCGGDTIEAAHIVFDRPAAPVAFAPLARPVANDAGETLGKVVQLSEFAAIRETLAACGGSRIETAKRLGISERTLRYRLAKAREQGDDLVRSATA
ncbi:sigma-54 interaction domain-containing protein [Sphingomonas corticis]|jgi:two-component system response regulator FlrC|uniref:Sigma 54-interacting transcriptional regulator n=1 Tax=Sphingomonas corticis TaxID=2722791 RepID=A0ABX1CUU4_9SPHN|nr:sigma 54-interacting transcriptional regulator [Sphingomonas corticis]NJR79745.1 sigma 54-interacting transcriptional regulator [Sphingomonas corticis]